jgi:hypothetical protein
MKLALKVAPILLVSVAIALFFGRNVVKSSADPTWPCRDQLFMDGTPGESGDKTPEEAARDALANLHNLTDSVSEEEFAAANVALESSEGPDRYDSNTGELFLHDELFATIPVQELPDGTFFVFHMMTCAPATASADPDATPSAAKD